jgi:mannan polymerase II complex MNN10 subunit
MGGGGYDSTVVEWAGTGTRHRQNSKSLLLDGGETKKLYLLWTTSIVIGQKERCAFSPTSEETYIFGAVQHSDLIIPAERISRNTHTMPNRPYGTPRNGSFKPQGGGGLFAPLTTVCRWGLPRLSLFKVIFIILSMTVLIHRLYSHYEGHRIFVHAPIHTVERTCPEPAYILMDVKKEKPKICLTTLTDELERGLFQRILRWRNFDGLLELTWKNKQAYAEKYGYFLFDESMHLDRSRPPSWSKILAVHRLLKEEQCDWVWWIDADTVIMNSNKRVEDFLPAATEPQDFLLSRDHSGGYNAGGWLVRNTPYALEFLAEWWSMESYVKPLGLAKSGDNDAFKAMLAQLPEFDQHVLVPPRCTFNAFAYFLSPDQLEKIKQEGTLTKQPWYKNEAFFHKGDLLAHVAGYNNKELPVQMLLELAE